MIGTSVQNNHVVVCNTKLFFLLSLLCIYNINKILHVRVMCYAEVMNGYKVSVRIGNSKYGVHISCVACVSTCGNLRTGQGGRAVGRQGGRKLRRNPPYCSRVAPSRPPARAPRPRPADPRRAAGRVRPPAGNSVQRRAATVPHVCSWQTAAFENDRTRLTNILTSDTRGQPLSADKIASQVEMPSSLFGELGGGGLVEDQSAFRLALELSMLSLGEPMPTTNPLASPIGFAPPPDDRAKKSQNMTECVPVPSSEHVAEIVGRQGTVCLRLGSDRRRAPPPPLHKGARVAPARSGYVPRSDSVLITHRNYFCLFTLWKQFVGTSRAFYYILKVVLKYEYV